MNHQCLEPRVSRSSTGLVCVRVGCVSGPRRNDAWSLRPACREGLSLIAVRLTVTDQATLDCRQLGERCQQSSARRNHSATDNAVSSLLLLSHWHEPTPVSYTHLTLPTICSV
eukprot:226510-Rhodomonas_salina.2